MTSQEAMQNAIECLNAARQAAAGPNLEYVKARGEMLAKQAELWLGVYDRLLKFPAPTLKGITL